MAFGSAQKFLKGFDAAAIIFEECGDLFLHLHGACWDNVFLLAGVLSAYIQEPKSDLAFLVPGLAVLIPGDCPVQVRCRWYMSPTTPTPQNGSFRKWGGTFFGGSLWGTILGS